MILSNLANFQRHEASRGCFATAELLVELTTINSTATSSSGSLNFCMIVINNVLVRLFLLVER